MGRRSDLAPLPHAGRGLSVRRAPARCRGVAVLLAAWALAACEPATGPLPAASSSPALPITPATTAAMEKLHGEWLVTTPESLATAKHFEPQIAAAESPEKRIALEKVRDLNIRRVTTIVKVNASHLGFHTIGKPGVLHDYVTSRRYELLRATRHEVEIQLDRDVIDGVERMERIVLTLSGTDEIHAPDLAEFAGGTIWRRAGTPGAGLP